MFTTLDAAKRAAKRLHTALTGASVLTKLSACQETLAKALGYLDWHNLTVTIGSAQAPKTGNVDTLSALIKSNWPDARSLAAEIASTTLRTDSGQVTLEQINEWRRAWVKTIDQDALKISMTDTPRKKITSLPLAGFESCTIVTSNYLNEETAHTEMPIREYAFELKVNGRLMGLLAATLYDRPSRFEINQREVIEIADIISDYEVWTTKNIMGDYPDAFNAGVLHLQQFYIEPEVRGQGLGLAFLSSALQHIKSRRRNLDTLAYDPSEILCVHAYAGPHPDAVQKAIRQKTIEIIQKAVGQNLGKRSKAAAFSNERQGSGTQTILELNRTYSTGRVDQLAPMHSPDISGRLLAAGFSWQNQCRNSPGATTWPSQPQPKILPAAEYPEGWSPLSISMGHPVQPNPHFHDYMPRELEKIEVIFSPPDFEQCDSAPLNRPKFFNCHFENGEILTIAADQIPRSDVSNAGIAHVNASKPISSYAPSLPSGTLLALMMSNVRLLFAPAKNREAEFKVPVLVTVTLKPLPTTGISATDWDERPEIAPWSHVRAKLDATIAAAEEKITQAIAQTAQKDRETYHQRLKSTIIATIEPELIAMFQANSDFLPHPIGSLKNKDDLHEHLRNMTFYGEFWRWWRAKIATILNNK